MPEIVPRDEKLRDLAGIHLWHAPLSSCSQRVRVVLAETDQDYTSNIINLEKDEHATPEYQRIHPNGVVPALVDDGRLFIESVDIIAYLARDHGALSVAQATKLLAMADEAQLDLKLLTFEFLFRAKPPQPAEAEDAFQKTHKNEWLKQFRIDFVNGFATERLDAAIARTDAGFRHLDRVLSDGSPFLEGDTFSISDIAWMPNVHRFHLMDWPFERTPHLAAWFARIAQRPSYKQALLDWQPQKAVEAFRNYTLSRQLDKTDLRSFPHFQREACA